ncbi:MAG: hypothetical protein H8E49_00490, partial [Gammaproteobacteria bacterium]|nr:hypothetical protein [Gammaproteobacteria bacterium]
GKDDCHIVKLDRKNYKAKNLVAILENKSVSKIFHFARFDVAVLKHFLKANTKNIYCTKVATRSAMVGNAINSFQGELRNGVD